MDCCSFESIAQSCHHVLARQSGYSSLVPSAKQGLKIPRSHKFSVMITTSLTTSLTISYPCCTRICIEEEIVECTRLGNWISGLFDTLANDPIKRSIWSNHRFKLCPLLIMRTELHRTTYTSQLVESHAICANRRRLY